MSRGNENEVQRRSPKAQNPPWVRASISFPSDLYETLEGLVKHKKVSLAWVVRDAAEKYVEDQRPSSQAHGVRTSHAGGREAKGREPPCEEALNVPQRSSSTGSELYIVDIGGNSQEDGKMEIPSIITRQEAKTKILIMPL